MVSISKILSSGLIFASQDQFRNVNSPELASKEQYNIVKYLAAAGPYVQNPGSGISTDIPPQCTVSNVQYLSRHGERYPGVGSGKAHKATVDKLQSYGKSVVGPLSFIKSYTYYVDNEELYELETTPMNSKGPYTGYETCSKAGASFRTKYGDLYNENDTLPIFIAASKRVYDSAMFFTQGFLGEEFGDKDKFQTVVVSEEKSQGINSLTPRWGCTKFKSDANDDIVKQFPTTYLDTIAKRLTEGNENLDVTTKDVTNMFELCAYELNARGYSPFCDLFTQDELVTYGYFNDLNFYYSTGPGGKYTREIGSVQVDATLKLLKDETSNNKIWVTFTHDSDIEIFHAALGLFDTINPLPADRVEFRDTYHHVDIVPMGGRTITEKLKCGDDTYVRFVINDAVVTVPGCADGPGYSCKLQDFEKYVHDRLGDINLVNDCAVPDDVPQALSFYWDYLDVKYDAEAPRTTA